MQRVAILYSKNPKLMYLMQKILYKNAMCVFLTDILHMNAYCSDNFKKRHLCYLYLNLSNQHISNDIIQNNSIC